jgi:hypothetical protein
MVKDSLKIRICTFILRNHNLTKKNGYVQNTQQKSWDCSSHFFQVLTVELIPTVAVTFAPNSDHQGDPNLEDVISHD